MLNKRSKLKKSQALWMQVVGGTACLELYKGGTHSALSVTPVPEQSRGYYAA